MATVLITGGTGLIGKALTHTLLNKNYEVIILTRDLSAVKSSTPGLSYAQWNIQDQTIDNEAVAKADYIVHLAGAGVADKRWTAKRKQEIVQSRVKSGNLIVKSLQQYPNAVKAIICASAIGWYGPDTAIPNPRPFTEDDPAAADFLGTTCLQWENSLAPLAAMGKRMALLRTGIVLSKDGGALKEFKMPLKFYVAAILGSGRQKISWIHIDDLVRLYVMAIEDDRVDGVYNAVAPAPVSNRELTMQLARTEKGKFFIPVHVPSFMLRLLLGEMSIEVLKSATVSCHKLLEKGFDFLFPDIDGALHDLAT